MSPNGKRAVGPRFPTVVASWRRAWTHVIPFFACPPEVGRVIDTTNMCTPACAKLSKRVGHFPKDAAATTLIWLALRNITARWGEKASNDWHRAMEQFAILYEDRFTRSEVQ